MKAVLDESRLSESNRQPPLYKSGAIVRILQRKPASPILLALLLERMPNIRSLSLPSQRWIPRSSGSSETLSASCNEGEALPQIARAAFCAARIPPGEPIGAKKAASF